MAEFTTTRTREHLSKLVLHFRWLARWDGIHIRFSRLARVVLFFCRRLEARAASPQTPPDAKAGRKRNETHRADYAGRESSVWCRCDLANNRTASDLPCLVG